MGVDKKNLAMGLMAGVVIGGATLGTIGVSAQSSDTSVADRIADRFSLSSDEVQAEFDAIREEKMEAHEAEHAERIAGFVEDGTLTQEQADALEARREEMKAAREELKNSDLSREEMKAQMQEAKEEFKAWAEEQGIDLEAIRPEKGEGRRGHGHRGGFFGGNSEAEASSDVEPATFVQ